jgi:hypothetical protein
MNIYDQVFHPHWYRFDDYVIQDSYIRPKSGARLKTYSPVGDVDEPGNVTRHKHVVPYQPLLDLLAGLGIQPSSRSQLPLLTDDHRAAIIEWCNHHGLFGLLPHLTHFAFLAARYKLTPQFQQIAYPTKPLQPPAGEYFQSCYAVQGGYSRENGAWTSSPDYLNHSFPREFGGQLVSDKQTLKVFREPGVLFEKLETGMRQWEPFVINWKRFFPSVPKEEAATYEYAFPPTEHFWQEYAEPVDDFLRAAQLLQNALVNHSKGRPQGLRTLQRLINPIGIAFEAGKDHGIKTMRWRSPSLLASYAMMTLLDFNSGQRPYHCERDDCGKMFVSSAYQARYCSSSCRFAVLKRGQRERNAKKEKEARRLDEKGMPVSEIALKLGSDPKKVREWLEQKRKASARQ